MTRKIKGKKKRNQEDNIDKKERCETPSEDILESKSVTEHNPVVSKSIIQRNSIRIALIGCVKVSQHPQFYLCQ